MLQEARSIALLASLRDMAIEIDPASNRVALSETLQLARRHGLYDASCLELALREDLPLATLDADLRMALKKAGGRLALERDDWPCRSRTAFSSSPAGLRGWAPARRGISQGRAAGW